MQAILLADLYTGITEFASAHFESPKWIEVHPFPHFDSLRFTSRQHYDNDNDNNNDNDDNDNDDNDDNDDDNDDNDDDGNDNDDDDNNNDNNNNNSDNDNNDNDDDGNNYSVDDDYDNYNNNTDADDDDNSIYWKKEVLAVSPLFLQESGHSSGILVDSGGIGFGRRPC